MPCKLKCRCNHSVFQYLIDRHDIICHNQFIKFHLENLKIYMLCSICLWPWCRKTVLICRHFKEAKLNWERCPDCISSQPRNKDLSVHKTLFVSSVLAKASCTICQSRLKCRRKLTFFLIHNYAKVIDEFQSFAAYSDKPVNVWLGSYDETSDEVGLSKENREYQRSDEIVYF